MFWCLLCFALLCFASPGLALFCSLCLAWPRYACFACLASLARFALPGLACLASLCFASLCLLCFVSLCLPACLLAPLLACFMEHSPSWEANRFSASQEIPRIVWNPKVHYRIHRCPPPIPILSQLDPARTPISHFLKIVTSTPGSPKWSLSLRLHYQNPVYATPLAHTRYMPRPSHSSRCYHLNNHGWGVQIIQLHIMHWYFLILILLNYKT